MKKTYNILKWMHYICTGLTAFSFLVYLFSLGIDDLQMTAYSVTFSYLNFLLALLLFIPLLIYLVKFKDEVENSLYIKSYVIYVVSTIASIMLIPIIQSII